MGFSAIIHGNGHLIQELSITNVSKWTFRLYRSSSSNLQSTAHYRTSHTAHVVIIQY